MALAHQLVVITRENPEENVWLDTERVFFVQFIISIYEGQSYVGKYKMERKEAYHRFYGRWFLCDRPKRDRKIPPYHEAMGRIVPVFTGRILSDAEE